MDRSWSGTDIKTGRCAAAASVLRCLKLKHKAVSMQLMQPCSISVYSISVYSMYIILCTSSDEELL